MGVKNIRKVTLKGKLIEKINYSIDLNVYNRFIKDIVIIEDPQTKLVGLMSTCQEVILKPTYNHINAFNKEGLAVCFKENSIQVINTKGKTILKDFIPFKVNYKDLKSMYSRDINKLQVNNDILIISDGAKYLLYNIKINKEITGYYDEIKTTTIMDNSDNKKFYYQVRNGDRIGLVDSKTGEILITPLFKKIIQVSYSSKYKSKVVYGQVSQYNRVNEYIVNSKKFLIPTGTNAVGIVPIKNSEFLLIKGSTGNINKKSHAIFDLSKKAIVFGPTSLSLKQSPELINNAIEIKSQDGELKLYDINKKKYLDIKISKKSEVFHLENDKGKKATFVVYTFYPDENSTGGSYVTVYGPNWKIFIKKIDQVFFKAKKDIMYYRDVINGKSKYTAFDINGNIIGEKRSYNP